MESQPQNPEFRNNPENFHPCDQRALVLTLCDFCYLLINFAKSLDPDQDQYIVCHDLDPNSLTLIMVPKSINFEKVNKSIKLPSMKR